MLLIQPVKDDSAGAFPQVVQAGAVPTHRLSQPLPLTHGRFHVTDIVSWDEVRHWVYFVATRPDRPGVRHLFRVGDSVGKRLLKPEESKIKCLSCVDDDDENVVTDSSENDTKLYDCEYLKAFVSPKADFYAMDCLGPGIPYSRVYSLPSNKPLSPILDANDDLRDSVSKRAMPKYKEFTVPLPESKIPARVRLILPPGLREYEEFIFPLVVNVYGGPGSQDVSSRWTLEWDHYLASHSDFIVAHMDVRGSGFAGDDFKHSLYHSLGTVEVTDSLHVLKHILDNYSFIDRNRVAVWGWSYGGFLATRMAVEDKDNTIHCTAAVAPVTKWQLYGN